MIEWVDRRLAHWGLWKRGGLDIGYGESPIARLIRGKVQQSGGAKRITIIDIDETEALETDAAIAKLPSPLPLLLSVWYGSQAPADLIAKRFRVCRRTVYIWRDRAHDRLATTIRPE